MKTEREKEKWWVRRWLIWNQDAGPMSCVLISSSASCFLSAFRGAPFQGLTVWVQAQPHAVSRLHVTCENFNDDAGSPSPHTVQLYYTSLCQTSNMWQILRNSIVIFGGLRHSPLASKPVLQIHWSVSRGTTQNRWQKEVDVCTPRALHAGCKIWCVCACVQVAWKSKRKGERGHVRMRGVRWGCLIQSQRETVDICAFFPFIMWLGLFCAGLATNLPCSTFSMPLVV